VFQDVDGNVDLVVATGVGFLALVQFGTHAFSPYKSRERNVEYDEVVMGWPKKEHGRLP
jgi:hypothetical protein